jgi:hypothetical protein
MTVLHLMISSETQLYGSKDFQLFLYNVLYNFSINIFQTKYYYKVIMYLCKIIIITINLCALIGKVLIGKVYVIYLI